jgi:hypothetical protein
MSSPCEDSLNASANKRSLSENSSERADRLRREDQFERQLSVKQDNLPSSFQDSFNSEASSSVK